MAFPLLKGEKNPNGGLFGFFPPLNVSDSQTWLGQAENSRLWLWVSLRGRPSVPPSLRCADPGQGTGLRMVLSWALINGSSFRPSSQDTLENKMFHFSAMASLRPHVGSSK